MLNSCIHRDCPRLIRALTAATDRLLRFLTGLTPASPGALRSTLSLGALCSIRQQVTIPVFREAITAPLPCCRCIHVMRLYMHSLLRSERGCSVTQHQVSARQSACTHEKKDVTTSRFVRVIYSSHVVYNRVGIVSNLPKTPTARSCHHPWICDVEVSVRCMASWTCLLGLLFFSLELSLGRMASQSHSRSWSVAGAHVQ